MIEQAAMVLGHWATVEKTDVEVPMIGGRRTPRLVLRFSLPATSTSDENALAHSALQAVLRHLAPLAQIAPESAVLLTRRDNGRFTPLGAGGAVPYRQQT